MQRMAPLLNGPGLLHCTYPLSDVTGKEHCQNYRQHVSTAIFALTYQGESGSAYVERAWSAYMSPSPPARQSRRPLRPPQAESNRSRRGEAIVFVARSIFMMVAAVSVISASSYLAYLIGRKQVAYEELRRQVDRVVKLIDEKRAEEELAVTTLKQPEKLEQNSSALTGLTTSTINGKTTAVPEPMPVLKPITASLIDDTAVAPSPPSGEVGLPPPVPSLNSVTKHHEMRSAAPTRASRRQKVSSTSAVSRRAPAGPPNAEQSRQFNAAAAATPDVGLGGQ